MTLSGVGAKAARWSRPSAVQVATQSASASLSRRSHVGVVQMSLACAEADHGRPVISAA